MSEEVYQEVWSSDPFGFSVSGREADGAWTDPDAAVLLNEQVRASGQRQIDLATQPLFARVQEDRLEDGHIYAAFIALLNNYVVNFRDPETTSPAEQAEIDAFLQIVLESEPMKIVRDYISTVLVRGLSAEAFRGEVRRAWFEPYTNHFRGQSTHFCTGFEHVFVGEGKYRPRDGATTAKGEVSGYHSWVKFFLDERSERVNYLGYKYDLNGHGPNNPNVVTMQFVWNHVDLNGSLKAELFKPTGGFFVGTSPAVELALGTLAFYEGHHGLLQNQRKRVKLGEGTFDLVMYHETLAGGGQGPHVRSFFPKLIGAGSDPDGGTSVRPVGSADSNEGLLRIAAALPNPVGGDEGYEWVEVENVGEAPVVLSGYELRDKMARPQPIPETRLEQGQTVRVEVERATPHMMQVSNRRGLISLHDESGTAVAAVSYGTAREGEVLSF